MSALRRLIAERPLLWAAAVLLALAARLAVPGGFMPARVGGHAYLLPCSGHGVMAMGGHRHGGHEGAKPGDQPCGFGALADAATGGAGLVLLAAALAFAMARALRPQAPPPTPAPRRLRPPLRAPPGIVAAR